jgi:DNA-directed RNA polymerase specialized sigma24 family protein
MPDINPDMRSALPAQHRSVPAASGATGDPAVARRQHFEALFGEVYEPLQRYVRRRAPASLVDEVVAETLTVLWRRLDEVPNGLATSWSMGVARRCLANARRSDVRRERLSVRLSRERPYEPPPPLDPGLERALGELGDDDRELLRLWAWEELAPREIAEVLGISANAASIRLHRAKQRLAECLQRKNGAPPGHEQGGCTQEGTQ